MPSARQARRAGRGDAAAGQKVSEEGEMASAVRDQRNDRFKIDGLEDPTAGEGARLRAGGRAQSLADPAPLGLAALALPAMALGLINIGVTSATAFPVVLTTILFYGGIGQLLVAMWEVARGNTFGVMAFGTFGCFNIAFWHFFSHNLAAVPEAEHPGALALFLGLWAVPALLLWIASFRTTVVVNAIFLLATFLLTAAAIGNGSSNETLVKVGGYLSIALACVAWYGCLAALLAETFGRVLLPNPHLGQRR